VHDRSNEAPMPKTSPKLSAVSIEHRLVTDTDRLTDTGPWLVPALSLRRAGKIGAQLTKTLQKQFSLSVSARPIISEIPNFKI